MIIKRNKKRLGWVITGSGHFFEECLDIMSELGEFDLFVSKAAEEVVRMYRKKNANFPIFPETICRYLMGSLKPRLQIFVFDLYEHYHQTQKLSIIIVYLPETTCL